jgi:simple sugar transport system permease protein
VEQQLRIPVLIATLATRGIFVGSLLAYISVGAITTLPGSLGALPYKNLVTVPYGFGQSVGLQVVFVPVAVICLLVGLALRYTVHGRQIYAIGGSEESARRAGVPIRLIKVTVLSVVRPDFGATFLRGTFFKPLTWASCG